MTDHLKLLGLVVNIAVGASVAIIVWQRARSSASGFLKPISFHVVLMNAAVWLLFINRYSAVNMPLRSALGRITFLDDAGILLVYIIYAGMVYAIMHAVWGILNKRLSRRLNEIYLTTTALLVLGYGVKWLVPKKSFLWYVHFHVYENIFVLYIVLEFWLLIHLWRSSVRETDAAKARLEKSFSFLYLFRYAVILAGALVVPQVARAFVFLLILNIIPVVWLKFYFQDYERERIARERAGWRIGGAVLDETCRCYNVSSREREILELVLAGKSNREIEQALFISYHTVKNHIYNLFQKFSVKNRFELARKIAGTEKDQKCLQRDSFLPSISNGTDKKIQN